jgi:hypothetical protein
MHRAYIYMQGHTLFLVLFNVFECLSLQQYTCMVTRFVEVTSY